MANNNTTFKYPGDLDSEIWEWLKEHGTEETKQVIMMTARHFAGFTAALQQQAPLPTIKGWIARDMNEGLFFYPEKPTFNKRFGGFWRGDKSVCLPRKSFPDLSWKDNPIEVELIIKPIQEQPKVDTKMRVCDKLEMEKLYGEE